MSRTFYIIGAGMGAPDSLTGEAARALAASDAVFATRRLTAVCDRAAVCPFDRLAAEADRLRGARPSRGAGFGRRGLFQRRRAPARAARAARGRCGWSAACRACSISARSAAFRMTTPACAACTAARAASSARSATTKRPSCSPAAKTTPRRCAATLADAGLGGLTVHLGENLGAPDERIQTGTAAERSPRRAVRQPGRAADRAPGRGKRL